MIAATKRRVLFAAALALAAAVFLLPQLWLFSLSLKNKAGIYEYPPRWIPADASFANYRFALTHTQVPWYLWNSAKVAGLATALTLLLAVPAAFALSRERFPRREGAVMALLAVQMVSPMVLLVPIYGLEAGRAAAVAVVMLALNLALALAAVRVLNRPRRIG